LILQANPDLSWRDVQGVLATTSQMVDVDDPSWTTNAAGISHSYLYGFGIIDAAAAVAAAQSWKIYSPEAQLLAESGSIDVAIPEYPGNAVTSSINLATNGTIVVESVVLYLDLSHSSRGDLEIVLISPSGTESIMHPGQRPENKQGDERWKLTTVRNWNELASGDWTLRIVDQSPGDFSECADIPWSIDVGQTLDCQYLSVMDVCEDGGQGSRLSDVFGGVDNITDSIFLDANGLGPADACCECGGGSPASLVADLLKSWRLMVYGHEMTATSTATPSPASSPAQTTTPVAMVTSNPAVITSLTTDAPVKPSTSSTLLLGRPKIPLLVMACAYFVAAGYLPIW